MIRPLRRAHRSAFVALALFLPALLASAWRVRREPLHAELPEELLPGLTTPLEPDWVLGDDELVYWVADEDVESRTELPGGAELAGTVRSGALGLLPPAGKRAVTYSLPYRLVNATRKDLPFAHARAEKQP